MQKFEAIGNLTRDLELRTVNETTVTTIPIAVNNKKDVLFVDVDVWGKDAENACKYLKKGSKIFFSASLKNKTYEKDGVNCHTYSFTADYIEYLNTPKEN